MDTATGGVAQQEDEEQGIDQQDMFYRVVPFLAALTYLLCSRVLGVDEAPCRPVLGTRGASGVAAGATTPGAGASSRGVTPVAASTSETPRRWARALRDRAGAAPRVRSAASHTGRSPWIHWLAVLWRLLKRRPCPTWRLYAFLDTTINKSRSSGVGSGQCW